MNRQQILNLYDWSPGICFQHPGKGEVPTTVLKVIRAPHDGEHPVRACADCVIAIEDARRETAARSGSVYQPGPVCRAVE